MESALTPREIQARVRSGESLAEVAKAAGVPLEQVEPYAAPVLAERAHLAATALSNPVRRRGEGSSVRALRVVVAERLLGRGIDSDTIEWDAWRNADRSWTVRGRYHSGSAVHEPEFSYDQARRFSVAGNDDARWLINESSSAHGPQPGRRRPDPDAEPTVDLNDELALVRATADGGPPVPIAPVVPEPVVVDDDEEIVRVDDDDEELAVPEYAPVELDEVNGVYDIIPTRESDLDVLYGMLSAFNEDSVNIYAGLSRPVSDEDAPDASRVTTAGIDAAPTPATPGAAESPDSPPSPQSPASPSAATPTEVDMPTEVETPSAATPAEAESPVDTTADEQSPLIDAPVPAPKPRQVRKKGRASVPSWDEIMFGGPTPKDPN